MENAGSFKFSTTMKGDGGVKIAVNVKCGNGFCWSAGIVYKSTCDNGYRSDFLGQITSKSISHHSTVGVAHYPDTRLIYRVLGSDEVNNG